MAFRLNDKHKIKPPGQRTRGKRTIAKERLYKHISQRIRADLSAFQHRRDDRRARRPSQPLVPPLPALEANSEGPRERPDESQALKSKNPVLAMPFGVPQVELEASGATGSIKIIGDSPHKVN